MSTRYENFGRIILEGAHRGEGISEESVHKAENEAVANKEPREDFFSEDIVRERIKRHLFFHKTEKVRRTEAVRGMAENLADSAPPRRKGKLRNFADFGVRTSPETSCNPPFSAKKIHPKFQEGIDREPRGARVDSGTVKLAPRGGFVVALCWVLQCPPAQP